MIRRAATGALPLHLLCAAAGLVLAAGVYSYPLATFGKYLAAALGGLAVLYSPTAGLYLVAGLLPFLPNLSLLLLGGLVGFSFLLHRVWQRRLQLVPLAIEPPLLLFIAGLFLFSAVSVYPQGSLRELGLYLVSFLLFFVLVNQLDSKARLYRFLVIGLLAAFVVSLYGIYQYLIGIPVESAWVDMDRHPLLRTRVYSVFGNPNILAEYLVMLIPFGLALAWSARDGWKRSIFLGITGIMALTLLLTFSRGGWVGLAAALGFLAFLKDWRYLLLLIPLAFAGFAFLPQVVLERLLTIFSLEDTSNIYRLVVWQEAMEIIGDYWATGVGLGHQSFMEIYPYYMITRIKTPFHVHNTYLQFLVETGIMGFALFIWLLASIMKQGIQGLRQIRDPFLNSVIAAALAATVGVLTQGFGEHILYMPKVITLFWLNAAVIFAALRLGQGGPKSPVKGSVPEER